MIRTSIILPDGTRLQGRLQEASPEDVDSLIVQLCHALVSGSPLELETDTGWVVVPPRLAARSYCMIIEVGKIHKEGS